MQCQECDDDQEEVTVNMIGKGGGKKGSKGDFKDSFICAESGGTRRCTARTPRAKARAKSRHNERGTVRTRASARAGSDGKDQGN